MKKWLKWLLGIIIGVVVIVGLLLVLPFLVDLSSFKPQIQAAVEKQAHAKVDFSSARLTILTGLGVRLADVVVENTDADFRGTRLFAVKELVFRAELMPLLQKKFSGEVLIDKPEIVLATKGLKSNVTSLMKPSDAPVPSKPAPTEAPAEKPGKPPIDLEKDVVVKALRITQASFTMRDLNAAQKEPIRISGLDLTVTNIGLNRDIKTKLTTKADVSQPGVEVHGPIALNATTHIKFNLEKKVLENATFDAALSFDALNINARNAFVKSAGIPLNIALKGSATPTTATLEFLKFNLHTISLGLQAQVTSLATLATNANLKFDAKNLKDLGTLLPQHKALLTDATIALTAQANGAFKQPNTVKASLALKTVLGGSDLSVDAGLEGLEPPRAKVSVVSRKLDIGALVKPFLPPPGQPAPAVASPPPAAKPEANPAPGKAAPAEPGLPPELKKTLTGALVEARVNLGEILYEKIKVEKLELNFKQESLNAILEKFSFKALDTALELSARANLAPTPPTAQARLSIKAGKMNINDILAKLGVKQEPKKDTAPAAKETAAAPAAPAAAAPANTPPPQEFALTPDQKKLLRGVDGAVSIDIAGIAYDKINLDNIGLNARLANLRAAVEKFSVSGFGGVVDFAGDVDLNAAPLAYKAKVGLKQIRIEQLVALVKPEHKDLLKGAATILLDATGTGITRPSIEKTLNATGTFAMQEGEIHTKSVAAQAQQELEKMMGGLSVVAAADSAFKATEKLLENPLAKQALGKSNFDLGKIKADYEKIKNVKIADKATTDKSLKGVQGTIKIEKGRIHITSKKSGADGTLDMDASVGLDSSLGGGALYGFSPALKQKMVAQSKHAALLFDERGNLDLRLALAGTVDNPAVKLDLNPLRDRFAKNAKEAVEKEVKKATEDLINKSLKGKVDAAAAELKKRLAEEAAKKQAELKKAQDEATKKVNDAKAKAEAEAKKKADEQKKKGADAGKKALKGLFGK